jgi:hypothetical protein
MDKKIVQVENVDLGEYTLLQMTLYTDDVVKVHISKDMGEDEPQVIVDLDVPKRLFFPAALRLLEADQR